MKKVVLFFALIVGLLASASTLQAQTVNMNRYITLTVTDGAAIKLDFSASTSGNRVRIVSGSNTQDITVGTNWIGIATYTAGSTTMTIYGDITRFDCSGNGANLTAIDPSHNTRLEKLVCYGNDLSTQFLDYIFCALPDRTGKANGKIQPIFNSSSSNLNDILATNKQNAIAKNWTVQYADGGADIPATTGTYTCLQLNMSRYITLTVAKNSTIKLDFKAAAESTPVRIVSGSNTKDITIGTYWHRYHYTADDTTMTIYGDITAFNCYGNGANLTALDLSHNTQLKELDCASNSLTTLDVSGCTQLEMLDCYWNNLITLDVSHNTQLTNLACYYNNLTTLDVSGCTQLNVLFCGENSLTTLDLSHNTQLNILACYHNNLTTLDVSGCTQLKELWCYHNNLTTLDVSGCTQLSILYCQSNNFSTAALDDIFCSLPDLTGITSGYIYPLNYESDPNHATVLATNAQNAISKSWMVQYNDTRYDIPTTGTYVCGTPHPQPNMSRYITLTVAKDSAIKLDFKAATNGTPIRIVSGSNTRDITVGTSWYNGNFPSTFTVTADGTEMKVYGDLTGFICSENGANLTALDLSHNTELREFDCRVNRLTSLDLSHNTELAVLNLFYNQLTSLDLSHNTKLTGLNCSYNELLTLDVSHNTRLTTLDCGSNLLSSLNVDSNRLLAELNCSYNRIPSLDISHNTQLSKLACYGNYFTREVLDDIFCLLPDRSGIDAGTIEPLYDVASSEFDTVVATNKRNATNKNWKVLYADGNADVPTTGKHKCSATDIAEAAAEQAFTLYPNPVADVLYLSATARNIRIYNVYGIEVAHATDTDRVEVAHLPAGVYTVKADGTVAKMVKR